METSFSRKGKLCQILCILEGDLSLSRWCKYRTKPIDLKNSAHPFLELPLYFLGYPQAPPTSSLAHGTPRWPRPCFFFPLQPYLCWQGFFSSPFVSRPTIPFRAYSRPTSTTGHGRIAACRRLHDGFYPTQTIMQPAARSNPTLPVCWCFSGVMTTYCVCITGRIPICIWRGFHRSGRSRVHDYLDNLRSAI